MTIHISKQIAHDLRDIALRLGMLTDNMKELREEMTRLFLDLEKEEVRIPEIVRPVSDSTYGNGKE